MKSKFLPILLLTVIVIGTGCNSKTSTSNSKTTSIQTVDNTISSVCKAAEQMVVNSDNSVDYRVKEENSSVPGVVSINDIILTKGKRLKLLGGGSSNFYYLNVSKETTTVQNCTILNIEGDFVRDQNGYDYPGRLDRFFKPNEKGVTINNPTKGDIYYEVKTLNPDDTLSPGNLVKIEPGKQVDLNENIVTLYKSI
jgi:hypothetical protein